MTTSDNGVKFICGFEGFSATMYKDSVGLPTIGYGTRITYPNDPLMTATITEQQAEQLLKTHLTGVEVGINNLVTVPINQNQFDALASFCYNEGIGAFCDSTLLKKINVNPEDSSIWNEFSRWIYAGDEILPGLITRRKAEATLYFTPITNSVA